jgi:hypothetical protein
MTRCGCGVAAALAVLPCCVAFAQFHHRAKPVRVPPSQAMTFIKKDGTCVNGRIAKIEPKTLTIQTKTVPVLLSRKDLLQASQADSLVFSARSSWSAPAGVLSAQAAQRQSGHRPPPARH